MKKKVMAPRLLLLLFLLLGTTSENAFAQNSPPCASSVLVQAGDTLSGISNEYLGSFGAYQSIMDATNAVAKTDSSYATIENASQIRVGWKLCIPEGAASVITQSTIPSVAEPVDAEKSTADEATVTESAPTSSLEVEVTPTESISSTIAAPTPPSLEQFDELHPLMIEFMRQQTYPGSELVIEETLAPGSNYNRYVASHQSEGNKIFGLLTVPNGSVPDNGWPVILFNHGYIPPEVYRTAERYVAYQDAFARSGYISFKSDYRGHGSSEGSVALEEGSGGNRHAAYTTDVLNALASLKRRPDVDTDNIGMWGHSMGGQITLRAMVVSGDVKAGSIWAGTVANYATMWAQWEERAKYSPDWGRRMREWRAELVDKYGPPEENPDFWASISPNAYLADLSGPILLQHATGDYSVPVEYSDMLKAEIEAIDGDVAYFRYEGDDHNLAANLSTALARDVAFFNRHLK